jgi:hypothetical protein
MTQKTLEELQALRQRLETDIYRAKVRDIPISRNDVLLKNHEKVMREIKEIVKNNKDQ